MSSYISFQDPSEVYFAQEAEAFMSLDRKRHLAVNNLNALFVKLGLSSSCTVGSYIGVFGNFIKIENRGDVSVWDSPGQYYSHLCFYNVDTKKLDLFQSFINHTFDRNFCVKKGYGGDNSFEIEIPPACSFHKQEECDKLEKVIKFVRGVN